MANAETAMNRSSTYGYKQFLAERRTLVSKRLNDFLEGS